jgi:predicted esterase YcpF (UPF0227 family)
MMNSQLTLNPINTSTHQTKAHEQQAIKSVHVVYTVADKRGDKSVTVSRTGGYWCECKTFLCYGECKHTQTVREYREAEGRKF